VNAHETKLAERGDLEALRRIAERKAEAKARAKAARRARSARAPGKTPAERRSERKARRAVVRAEVFARVDRERQGRCEWYCAQGATDLHHVLNGGRRESEERVDTCAGICRDCHRAYEKADPTVLRNAATWAVEHGFREAAREIAHRIDKADEARR
jgi:hypothetical protein